MRCYITTVQSTNNAIIIGLDKQNFLNVKVKIFSYLSVLAYVLGAQKNRLTETVLLSTQNIYLVEK